MRRLIAIIALALVAMSCFDETAYRTDFIVQPFMQAESGGDFEALEGAVAYAFAGSSEEWGISTLDDALSGIATHRETGALRGCIAMADPFSSSNTNLVMRIEQEEIFVVVADPVSQFYAYSDYTIPVNLEELYVTVSFRSWKSEDYTASTWTFIAPVTEEDDSLEEESYDEELEDRFDYDEDEYSQFEGDNVL